MKRLCSPIPRKCIIYFFVFLMLVQAIGCNYFRIKKTPDDAFSTISSIGKIHKNFVVHSGKQLYLLNDLKLDSMFLSGKITEPRTLIYYYQGRETRYRSGEEGILNEVHIYLNDSIKEVPYGHIEIPLTTIKEIRIIEKDTGKIVASYILGTAAFALGVFVIIGIIAALTKSSCPYVYVNDGEGYIFEGEIFGGAIAPNLARDDYMPLPSINAKNGEYRVRISNELKEHQYTDLAELLVINHPGNQKILLDKSGQIQTISNPIAPLEAFTYSGGNLLDVIKSRERDVFLFNDQNYSKNGIVMKFKNTLESGNGKLILNAKNTLWFDYLFGEFLSKFGKSYEKWMKKQAGIPSEERIQKMIDSDFPLSVYIKKNGKWHLVDRLNTVGPLASRDFVVPVDLSDLDGEEIEIKIETGFMFWELDYAAMDFTTNSELEVLIEKPVLATGTGSMDWKLALEKADEQFMIQNNVGEVTEMVFKTEIPATDQEQTVFLHCRGYYELIRNFEGLPKVSELLKFNQAGYFSDFSRNKYLKMIDKDDNLVVNVN